jgi:hypothetical protein
MTPDRAELLRAIAEISEANPDLRLGQLITNLATKARGPQVEAIWDCEDEEFLAAARRLLDHYRARNAGPAIVAPDGRPH